MQNYPKARESLDLDLAFANPLALDVPIDEEDEDGKDGIVLCLEDIRVDMPVPEWLIPPAVMKGGSSTMRARVEAAAKKEGKEFKRKVRTLCYSATVILITVTTNLSLRTFVSPVPIPLVIIILGTPHVYMYENAKFILRATSKN